MHGLGTTEWSWVLEAKAYHGDPTATFGSLLAKDVGLTPIWLRYNMSRHVSSNGQRIARELERFVDAYPIPIEELILIGHSMGGLVVRSACHYGSLSRTRAGSRSCKRVISLGSTASRRTAREARRGARHRPPARSICRARS